MTDAITIVAAAIARQGFPRGRESAGEYRCRLARAAIQAMREPTYEMKLAGMGRMQAIFKTSHELPTVDIYQAMIDAVLMGD
jgi:hypothetical protein